MTTAELLTLAEVRERMVPTSVEHYHRLSALNLLPCATELIDGVVIRKITKSPLHEYLAQCLYDWFRQHSPEFGSTGSSMVRPRPSNATGNPTRIATSASRRGSPGLKHRRVSWTGARRSPDSDPRRRSTDNDHREIRRPG